ncbi:hypothetical protein [Thiorhodococcus minor]|uniref:Uncharacterized protein n=1 Tax=Thiorhodococcus minor TaxID=57489 RepID=A0A6M0K714_9GAMM|nr:hypothetical protein [Thiorhodococcus minor]NEV64135.1 hypothetical protein [Thiorhodococcus minor]
MTAAQQQMVANPFGAPATQGASNAVAASEQHRSEAEIQAAMVIAKRFPRDPVQATDRILQACTRPALAEGALYAYPRGSELVTGPSIRLAEALAQGWGNVQFGVRELSQSRGESTVEAFAWDLETNTRQVKVFQVAHVRHTRRGQFKLEDPRDVYELVANQGARRLRACILGILPGDLVEAAVKQCELTQANAGGATEEQVKQLVEAFAKIGVTQEQITKFLGHRLDSVIGAEVIRLRKVFTSIRDGMAKPGDFFPVEEKAQADGAQTLKDKLKAKAGDTGKPAETEDKAT